MVRMTEQINKAATMQEIKAKFLINIGSDSRAIETIIPNAVNRIVRIVALGAIMSLGFISGGISEIMPTS
jgi:hypothetical protein